MGTVNANMKGIIMQNVSWTRIACTITVIAATPMASAAQTTPPDEYMDLARGIFSELIEINTTNSERGNNTTAARALARRLLDAGFPQEDVQVLVPSDAPTKGNLVARYRGRDSSQKPILLLAHIDVVEALPEDWSSDLDPFSFLERDGFYYGRGSRTTRTKRRSIPRTSSGCAARISSRTGTS